MTEKSKGGRPRKGSAWRDKADGLWTIQITLPDGTRSKPRKLGPEITTEDRAREVAAAWTERAIEEKAARPYVNEAPVSTLAGWSDQWCGERERFGLSSVEDDRGRLRKWILPQLGAMAIRAVKRGDLERFVAWLDERVLAGALSAGTASNVWTLVQAMFRDAAGMPGRRKGSPKLPHLVVRSGDNPARDIAGPNAGTVKAKTYLYPTEFAALVNCSRIPLRWRIILAIGAYTYMRTGELEALEWSDVHLEHGYIHVHRAINRSTDEVKATKTNRGRKVPIEPTLAPLLAALQKTATAPRVVTMPPINDLADRIRKYLGWAGVTRADLFVNDATRKQIGFYDATRGSGITWCAIRGDDPLKLQTRCGHDNFETTQGYIKEAENLTVNVGEVFAPLPPALVSLAGESLEGPSQWAKLREKTWQRMASPAGFEPA